MPGAAPRLRTTTLRKRAAKGTSPCQRTVTGGVGVGRPPNRSTASGWDRSSTCSMSPRNGWHSSSAAMACSRSDTKRSRLKPTARESPLAVPCGHPWDSLPASGSESSPCPLASHSNVDQKRGHRQGINVSEGQLLARVRARAANEWAQTAASVSGLPGQRPQPARHPSHQAPAGGVGLGDTPPRGLELTRLPTGLGVAPNRHRP